MPTPLPSLSTVPNVAAPAKSAINPSLAAGPETQASAPESQRSFARALEQAASSDTAKDPLPPQSAEPTRTPAGSAHHDAPARFSGAAKSAQTRSATAVRLEKGLTPSAQLAQGATLGPGLSSDKTLVDPPSTAPALLEDPANDDNTTPEVGTVGALLSQLQAAATNQPGTSAGSTAATSTAATKAARGERDVLTADGPGARRPTAAARAETVRLASSGAKAEALEAALSLASPQQSTPSLPVGALDHTVVTAPNAERAFAAPWQVEPMATSASINVGLAQPALPSLLAHADSGVATAQAHLSASPGSPEFGPQLGAQITTFVRDGLEHARLQLHPADMGPVLVQIQLDGQTAQVHLRADHALTRQALEDAMPQLASQLQEAGLTLSGGGVSQQAQQGRQAPSDPPGGRTSSTAALTPPAAQEARQPAARRGVVDLVA